MAKVERFDSFRNRRSGIESGFLRFTLFTVIFFVLLWFVYRIQHVMLRNKFCAKLIEYASLTHYKFWGRYRLVSDERKDHQHNPP